MIDHRAGLRVAIQADERIQVYGTAEYGLTPLLRDRPSAVHRSSFTLAFAKQCHSTSRFLFLFPCFQMLSHISHFQHSCCFLLGSSTLHHRNEYYYCLLTFLFKQFYLLAELMLQCINFPLSQFCIFSV